jgi:hypothetical protein
MARRPGLAVIVLVLSTACVVVPRAASAQVAPEFGSAAPVDLVELARVLPAGAALASPLERSAEPIAPHPIQLTPGGGRLAARSMAGDRGRPMSGPHPGHVGALSGERSQALFRSLTLPGWGQASLGKRASAGIFGVLEAGVWGSFMAFKIQQAQRTETYLYTARNFAGIDLGGRSEEFRRMVGIYPSSDDYNKYVVARDAANLFYDENGVLTDPDGFNRYIEEHSLKGADTWAWVSPEAFRAYQEQRKTTQKAGLRANTALAFAVANRIVSALHAARSAGRPQQPQGWRLDVRPDANDPLAFELALRTSF